MVRIKNLAALAALPFVQVQGLDLDVNSTGMLRGQNCE
jgi:hypothetical protein